MQYATTEYLQKEMEYVKGNIVKSMPNLKPMAKSYKLELNELTEEIKSSEMIDQFGHYLEFLLTFIGSDTEHVQKALEGLITMLGNASEAFVNFVNSLPDLFNRALEGIPTLIQSIQKGMSITFDALVETFRLAVQGITGAIDSVSKLNPTVANQVGYLADTSKGKNTISRNHLRNFSWEYF